MEGLLPPPVTGLDRQGAVDVHQLRTGHRSQARSYLHSAQDRTSAGAGMPGLHKGYLQGVLVPAPPRTAQSTGPCPAELPGAYGDTAEKNRQHKPDAGGGPRDRAGGSHYQRRPEPTGYALSPLRVGGATTTAFNYRRAPSSPPCGSPPRSLVTQVGSTVRRAGGTGNRTRVLPTTEMVPYHLRHQSRKYR